MQKARNMAQKPVDNNLNAFTIVELLVSIAISVLLLGGIFYFMSDVILGISRSSAQSSFLKDFYGFTTVFDTGKIEILYDYTDTGFDVGLLKTLDNQSGILIGVVDRDTLMLSPDGMLNTYHNSMLAYRSVSSLEIANIELDPSVIYDYEFFSDKVFSRFNLKNFQLLSYNSGDTVEMLLDISPIYIPGFQGQEWQGIPQDEIFTYSLVF